MADMRPFHYDIENLIKGVKDRPCLWNKTLESYKDRVARRAAWEEVFLLLDPTYEEITDEEKRLFSEQVLNKWTNVRDTFIKSLKTKMGKPKRKYILHDQLKFLIPTQSLDESSFIELEINETSPKIEVNDSMPKVSKRSRKRTCTYEEEPRKPKYEKTSEDFPELDEYNDPRVMNEDEAFFASLLPSVVNYSEDERLEFRIQVLEVMKRINDKRKYES